LTSSTDIQLKSSDAPPAAEAHQDLNLIHPLSAALLIAVDSLWTFADWAVLAWMVTIPLSFLAVFLPSFLIQKHFRKDPAGKSAAVAAFLGVLAAIPTPITGTMVGTMALALAGFRSLRTRGSGS
jgi:hypothetical protein